MGAKPGQRGGGGGGIRPRNGRTRGLTQAHAAFFLRAAHLPNATATGGGAAGGDGDGFGGGAGGVGRRADAAGGRRDARRGSCGHGSTTREHQPTAERGQKRHEFDPVAAVAHLLTCREAQAPEGTHRGVEPRRLQLGWETPDTGRMGSE